MASLEYELRQTIESARRRLHDARHEFDRAVEKFEDRSDEIFKELGEVMERVVEREVEKQTKG